MSLKPKLEVENLSVTFRHRRREPVYAVRGVSFEVQQGETLGIVGESGCGKTTLSRAILGLVPFSGSVAFDAEPLRWVSSQAREMRQKLQLIFQDPFASLNPRLTIRKALGEPLEVHRDLSSAEIRKAVDEMLMSVGMDPADAEKYPHQFSGGQRQRIAIARALILQPEMVIADEPVSALDVSVQAQILNLLADVKRDMGLTMLFISHDLSVIRHVADRVLVMNSGEIVERGATAELMQNPRHPYTQKLLEAAPKLRL
jgi:ABC-type oligopeptide transport system ATPase subunit